MKSMLANSSGILLMIAGSAFADTGAGGEESGWLWMLFLGFGALIIVFQLVPSMILFGSMLKGLFSSTVKETTTAAGDDGTKGS